MKTLVIAMLSLAAGATSAAQLHNNGAVVAPNGYSMLSPGALTYGVGAQSIEDNAVADDFTITGNGWNIADFSFYAYQTGLAGFSYSAASWAIIAGANANNGTVVASGVSALTNGGLLGYRQDQTRGIYQLNADIDDVTLGAGHYWLAWTLEGDASASGPWVPPVADGRTGNAQQSFGSEPYALLTDSGNGRTMELPFVINGTAVTVAAVPEPQTYAMLLGGLGLLGWTARRRHALHALS